MTECVEPLISEKVMDLNLCYQIRTFHCSFPGSPTHLTFPTKIAFTFTWKWYLKGWGEQFGGNYSVFLHMSHVNKGVYLLNFLFVFLLLFCFTTGMLPANKPKKGQEKLFVAPYKPSKVGANDKT